MAIDPSIALGGRPLQIDNPLDAAGKALAMRQLMLQNQTGELNFADQQRLRGIYQEAGGDPSKIETLLWQGGFPDRAIAINKDLLANKEATGKIAETEGKVAKQKLDMESQLAGAMISTPPEQRAAVYPQFVAKWNSLGLSGPNGPGTIQSEQWNDSFLPHLQAIASRGLTPVQVSERADYANVLPSAPGKLVQPAANTAQSVVPQDMTDVVSTPLSGTIIRPPNTQPGAAPLASNPQPEGTPISQNTPLPAMEAAPVEVTAKAPVTYPEQLREQAAIARAKGTKAGFEISNSLMAQANQLDERILQEKGLSQTEAHQKVTEAQGAEHLKQGWIQTDPFGTLRSAATNFSAKGALSTAPGQPDATQAQGNDFLATIPKPLADQVKALAEGRLAFPAGFALKSPYWQNMLQMVSQYDPSFDAVNFNARAATRKDFTSGTSAKSVTALNTVIGHLDTLSQAADNLNNTNYPKYNSIANWIQSNRGESEVKTFENTRKAVVDELTRVWRGTGGSEGDIKSWTDTIGAANSPAQLHGVIKNIGDLLESRINALSDQYSRGMGTTEQGLQLVTPQSRATLTRLERKAGGSPSAATAPAVQGVPTTNAKGWTLHVDPQGNKAYVSPDGKQFEEVK